MSETAASAHRPPDGAVCISVHSPGRPAVPLSGGFIAVLRLEFSDIFSPARRGTLMTSEQARQVLEFARRWRGASEIVIHCEMGASRSAGIKLGLLDAWGQTTPQDEADEPLANPYVRALIREVAAGNPAASVTALRYAEEESHRRFSVLRAEGRKIRFTGESMR